MSGRDDQSEAERRRGALKEAGPYITLGLELGLTMIAWTAIGYLIDRWQGTLPWFTLAGVFVGMASLFLQLARAARRSDESARRRSEK